MGFEMTIKTTSFCDVCGKQHTHTQQVGCRKPRVFNYMTDKVDVDHLRPQGWMLAFKNAGEPTLLACSRKCVDQYRDEPAKKVKPRPWPPHRRAK